MAQQPFSTNDDKFVYFTSGFKVGEQSVNQYEIGIVLEGQKDYFTVLIVRLDVRAIIHKNMFEFFNPYEVGDSFPKKVCNVCQRYLDTNLFVFNQNGRDNRRIRRPSCNDCRKVIDGVNLSQYEKIRWEKTKPFLVPFKCPICGKTTIPGLTSKVVLDHDHLTGKVRGWICDSCNTGIGRFKDDIELLKKAINYLEN